MIPKTMSAMVLMGHGGMEQLVWHEDWPVPTPSEDQVLIKVAACGLNNTDVNTRTGWYSKAVTERTTGAAYEKINTEDPSWGGAPIAFPRIQGADVCGHVVALGKNAEPSLLGRRVITDNWLRDWDDPLNLHKTGYFGSEADGGFAEYVVLHHRNVCPVNAPMSDVELATFACSYATAEGMLTRAVVTAHDTVLVTGASGGVGSAVIQLAKARGARVVALASPSKHERLAPLGADVLLPRAPVDLEGALREAIGTDRVSVVADIAGGDLFSQLVGVLDRGGRYTCSGAIAGPIVSLDLRTLYLNDLTFTGSTVNPPETMARVVAHIEAGHLQPLVAAQYPLRELHRAQQAFIDKSHVGNIVVTP